MLSSDPLRDLIYDRPNIIDNTLDDGDLAYKCPLDNGRHQPMPVFDVGRLESLPVEILSEVLLQGDLRTLTDFRRVNQRAMQIVDSIPQYRAIVRSSIASLRALLSIEWAAHVSPLDLYTALVSPMCKDCGDFGGFIYLLTCTRVCFLCFTECAHYLPLEFSEAARKFGLQPQTLSCLPKMRSLPGRYSPNRRTFQVTTFLLDPIMVYRHALSTHGSIHAMKRSISEKTWAAYERYIEWLGEQALGDQGYTPWKPPTYCTYDSRAANGRRFMAMVRAPWIDSTGKQTVWGFHCGGCKGEYGERPLSWRRKFIECSFQSHLEQCGDIKDDVHVPSEASSNHA